MTRGDVFPHPLHGESCRVMAVADGYVMARLKGCLPFVIQEDTAAACIESRRQRKKEIE